MHVSRSFRPAWIAVVLAVVAGMIGATPAYAITGGQPDNWGHPQVALLYADFLDDGEEKSTICSGTLVAPTVILTAGHCTSGFNEKGVTEVLVTFDDVVTDSTLFYTSSEWHTHGSFDWYEWPYVYDFGVVILNEVVTGIVPADLAWAGRLDEIIPTNGMTHQEFADVGYGQAGVETGGGPPVPVFPFERRVSVQKFHPGQNTMVGSLHGLDRYMLQLKSSPSARHGSGCGGDSGGPIFLNGTDTIVAIHTGGYPLGVDGSVCGRISSVNHRTDVPEVLDWLSYWVPIE